MSGPRLPNGVKVYRWALSRAPHLWDTTAAAKEFDLSPRTIRHWKRLIVEHDNCGNPLPNPATGPVIRQPIATPATHCHTVATHCREGERQPIAASRQPIAANIKGGTGGEKEPAKSPSPKTEKKARTLYRNPPFQDYPNLDSDEIREAWSEFISTKKRKAAGALADTTVLRHLKMLDELGTEGALYVLRYSADAGYPGLYPDQAERMPRTNQNGHRLSPTEQIFQDTLKRYEREAAEQKAQKETQCLLPPNHEL